jgi:hypothetical protein
VVFRRRLRVLCRREPEKLATFMNHFRDRATAELDRLTPEQIGARPVSRLDRRTDHAGRQGEAAPVGRRSLPL